MNLKKFIQNLKSMNKFVLVLVVLIVVFVVLLVVREFLSVPPADVISVSPKPGAEDVSLDLTARVAFDRQITESEVNVSVEPRIPFALKTSLEKESLIITFQESLEPGTTYTMTISGPNVYSYLWQFETEPEEVITPGAESRGDPNFSEAERLYYEKNPLLRITPVLAEKFKVVRTGQKQAKVYLYGEDKESARKSALNWFKENEINVDEIDITWIE